MPWEQVTEVCVLRVSYSTCPWEQVTVQCVLRVSYSACLEYRGVCPEGEL